MDDGRNDPLRTCRTQRQLHLSRVSQPTRAGPLVECCDKPSCQAVKSWNRRLGASNRDVPPGTPGHPQCLSGSRQVLEGEIVSEPLLQLSGLLANPRVAGITEPSAIAVIKGPVSRLTSTARSVTWRRDDSIRRSRAQARAPASCVCASHTENLSMSTRAANAHEIAKGAAITAGRLWARTWPPSTIASVTTGSPQQAFQTTRTPPSAEAGCTAEPAPSIRPPTSTWPCRSRRVPGPVRSRRSPPRPPR